MNIETMDFISFMDKIPEGTVDLILTDPPYAISRKTGFKNLGSKSIKRFAVSMDFGSWDHKEIDIDKLAELSFKVLRPGGTVVIFYDLWKISYLHESLDRAGFKIKRFIEWVKTNPVPLNSKVNYLTNAREAAVLGVKGSKGIFNSSYDNGIYEYPIAGNKRLHPTQKPVKLFIDLIKKHSNKGDFVIDPFIGSGTAAVASIHTKRRFSGCDINKDFVDISKKRINNLLSFNR